MNGLVTASQLFQKFLIGILAEKLDFVKSAAQPTLLWNKHSNVKCAVHVDDPLATGDMTTVKNFFTALEDWLTVRMGAAIGAIKPSVYLGCRYWRYGSTFVEGPMEHYMDGIVETAGLETGKPATTPGVKDRSKNAESSEYIGPDRHQIYRSVVGKVQFIVPRRPDLMYANKELGWQLHAPRECDWTAMKRLVRYIAGTRDKYLYLRVGKNYNKLVGYTDTDWAGDCTTRKSTRCAIVMWGDCVLHVHCRRQSVYGLSSPEAEYYGCCGVAAELLYLQSVLSDMGYNVDLEVHTDASGAKALAS